MQAALRIGAAYVPADGATPPARLLTIARDCAAQVICTSGPRMAQLAGDLPPGLRCLDLTECPTRPQGRPVRRATRACRKRQRPTNWPTSSTRQAPRASPKGVCISHRNARAFVDWARRPARRVPGRQVRQPCAADLRPVGARSVRGLRCGAVGASHPGRRWDTHRYSSLSSCTITRSPSGTRCPRRSL